MLSYSNGFYKLKERLQSVYNSGEASAIAHIFMEHITGLGKMDRLRDKDHVMSERQQNMYDTGYNELIEGRPIQYVTGKSWFLGREFSVNEHVLIPRPETEELVQWICEDWKNYSGVNVLDVGAGSGCIGLTLAEDMREPLVTCVEVSVGAIATIRDNIRILSANARKRVDIRQLDFLDKNARNESAERYDVIVSNPPYIPQKDAIGMHVNVTEYEPHIALFVPDDDALIFYRALADFGKDHLMPNGAIYSELESGHAIECRSLFEEAGYFVELRKDIHDNWRMLKAVPNR